MKCRRSITTAFQVKKGFLPALIFLPAPHDYNKLESKSVSFLPDTFSERVKCENISIHSDDIIENHEVFTITIATSDRAVDMSLPSSSVTILDSTGMSCQL